VDTMGVLAGVRFGTAAAAAAAGAGSLRDAAAGGGGVGSLDDDALDAATRCKAFPSLRSLVMRFSRCKRADGRVMEDNAASISSASRRRSWDRESAALVVVAAVG